MNIKRFLLHIFIITGIGFVVYSCANRAQGPTGGLKDETPPKVLKTSPKNGVLNFNKKQILIDFDEMVTVDNASENVIISPPQVKPPDVKSLGKRITVNFNQDLLDSTTYSINFGDAIVDLNEKNPLKNYLFSFSTGNEIDTLKISGTIINAEDLNPLQGVIVGIYKELDDSIFFQKSFLRIGKTDENGRFSIDNIKKGRYKIFALSDVNRDYFYQPGEGLATYDSIITPTFRIEQMQDTVWKDSATVDSIRTFMGTKFLPDDITMRYFKEDKKRQYYVKNERKDPFVFTLFFNAPQTELPQIKPLNFDWDKKYLLENNPTLDSLTYWITDSLVWNKDTLDMTMTYLKTDSVFNLVSTTDTISVIMRKAKIVTNTKSKKRQATEIKLPDFKFSNNVASVFELYNPIKIKFEAPLEDVDISKIHLSQKVDTIYKPITFDWKQQDSMKLSYTINYKWVTEETYQLKIDSAAFKSIYDRVSNKFVSDFKIRSLDEYSSVKMFLAAFNPNAYLQILDTKDVVLSTKKANEKGTLFEYLKPGDYYIRMFIDENDNAKWDTGDLMKHIQPENVYYFQKKLTLMANWEFEETWDYKQVPLLQQKPIELKKSNVKK